MFSLFLLIAASTARAFDCTGVAPFEPFEPQRVRISIDRIFWDKTGAEPELRDERICEGVLEIGAYDARGREHEWFYCFHQVPRPRIVCETRFRGAAAQIIVRPGVVLRSSPGRPDMRHSHAHIYVLPEGDWNRFRDTLVSHKTTRLEKTEQWLEHVAEVQGPDAGDETLGVKLHFQ